MTPIDIESKYATTIKNLKMRTKDFKDIVT